MGFFDLFKKWNNKRSLQMREAAFKIGGKYSRSDDYGHLNLLLDFKLFRTGRSKRIRHLIEVKDELKSIYIFDYHYRIGSGNSSRSFSQTVLFFDSKELGLAEFYMRPEFFLHRIKSWFGSEDIDFTSHPEFSKSYHLTGDEEGRIRDHFDEKVLQFFTIEKNWCLEGLNYFMIFYKMNKKLSPLEIEEYFKKGTSLYQHLKEEPPTFED